MATFRVSKSTLRFSAMIRPSMPSRCRIEWNSERCVASWLIEPSMYTSEICQRARVFAHAIIETHSLTIRDLMILVLTVISAPYGCSPMTCNCSPGSCRTDRHKSQKCNVRTRQSLVVAELVRALPMTDRRRAGPSTERRTTCQPRAPASHNVRSVRAFDRLSLWSARYRKGCARYPAGSLEAPQEPRRTFPSRAIGQG